MKKNTGYCLFCHTINKIHSFKFDVLDLDMPSSTLNCIYPHPTFYICEECAENLPEQIKKLESKKNIETLNNQKLNKLIPKIKKLGIQQSESTYYGDFYHQIANIASAKKHIDSVNALINIIVMTIDLIDEEQINYCHYDYPFSLNENLIYFINRLVEFLAQKRYSNIISYCVFWISSLNYEPFKCLENYVIKMKKLRIKK